MHVAVDIVGARISGSSAIALESIRSAIAHDGISKLTVYASPARERELVLPQSAKLHVRDMPLVSKSLVTRTLWLLGGFHRRAARDGARVVLGMSNGGVAIGPPSAAVYIHQALPFSAEALAMMPQSIRVRMRIIREVMRVSVRTASLVVVQTAAMRDMLIEAFGVSEQKFACITPVAPGFDPPLDTDTILRTVDALPTGGRFAYISGDLPYKNIPTLLAAFRLVRAKNPDASLVTVLPPDHPAAAQGVTCLGALNRGQLHALYKKVDAAVMPSIVESLSLPLLEAMEFGLPIVAVDKPYAHDACGDAARYVAPFDSNAMADAMRSVIEDRTLRQTLSQAGLARHAERAASRPFARMWDAILATA